MGHHDDDSCNAERSLSICGLFESELLIRLMLIHWRHPLADDSEYHANLLETATEVLHAAATDDPPQVFIQGLPSREMNLVAAIWYAERCALDEDAKEREERIRWLQNVQRSLPSCFCDPDELA